MNYVLVSSDKDLASKNIASLLMNEYSFYETNSKSQDYSIYQRNNFKLIKTSKELLFFDEPYLDTDAYIFLSRHKSESGIPSLTTHFPGNFSNAALHGGRPKELGYTFPSLHREYIRNLKNLQDRVPKYNIVTEPMHHGPTSFSKPILFVEIGSSEVQWNDLEAIRVMCDALIKTTESNHSAQKISVGIGGTHYSKKFTNILLKSEYAIGSIAPKYMLQYLDEYILEQMVNKSFEKVSYALLDWKSVINKRNLLTMFENFGLEIVKL